MCSPGFFDRDDLKTLIKHGDSITLVSNSSSFQGWLMRAHNGSIHIREFHKLSEIRAMPS